MFSGSPTTADKLTPGIWKVSANGGTPSLLVRTEKDRPLRWVHFLPDGKHFLYFLSAASSAGDVPGTLEGEIYTASIDAPSPKLVKKSEFAAEYSDGALLFVENSALMAQQLNLSTYTLDGQAELVTSPVATLGNGRLGATASFNGNLAIADAIADPRARRLFWRDRTGKDLGEVPGSGAMLRLSPSGKQLALVNRRNGQSELLVIDLARQVTSRFAGESNSPVWSPDEHWVAYAAARAIYRKPAGGLGEAELLLDGQEPIRPSDWSRDGKYLLYQVGPLGRSDLYVHTLDAKTPPTKLAASVASDGRFSPDSKWIVYTGLGNGRSQVMLRSFPGNEHQIPVSKPGAFDAQWRFDGKEIYFLDTAGQLNAVPVRSLNPPELGEAVPLFRTPTLGLTNTQPTYAPNADGSRFLVSLPAQEEVHDSIRVVLNWRGLVKK